MGSEGKKATLLLSEKSHKPRVPKQDDLYLVRSFISSQVKMSRYTEIKWVIINKLADITTLPTNEKKNFKVLTAQQPLSLTHTGGSCNLVIRKSHHPVNIVNSHRWQL